MKHIFFRACSLVAAAALFTACRDDQPLAPSIAPAGTPSFAETIAFNNSDAACMADDGLHAPNKYVSANLLSGNATVPMGSTCRTGLRLSRPFLRAVGSPNAFATQPCEISWSTMAMISGTSQVET